MEMIFGDLTGRAILDIGCGSNTPIHGQQNTYFPPWMCRTLNHIGAKPVGIDIGDLTREQFEHYTLDVTQPNALVNALGNRKFDAVYTRDLRGQSIRANNLVHTAEEIYAILLPQVEYLLNPNGVFIQDLKR